LPCDEAEDGGAEDEGDGGEDAPADLVATAHPGKEASQDGEVFEVDEFDEVGVGGEPPLAHVEHDGHVGLGVEADAVVIVKLVVVHVVACGGHVIHGAVVLEDGEHQVGDEDEEDGDGPEVDEFKAGKLEVATDDGEAEDDLECGEKKDAVVSEVAGGAEDHQAEGGSGCAEGERDGVEEWAAEIEAGQLEDGATGEVVGDEDRESREQGLEGVTEEE